MKRYIAAAMFAGGVVGAALSGLGVIAPGEPQWILQLSWAALWMEGMLALIVTHGEMKQSEALHNKLDATILAEQVKAAMDDDERLRQAAEEWRRG